MDRRKRIRLTKYSTKAGRASRFAPGDLERASEGLAPGSLGGFVGGMEARDGAGYGPFGGGPLPQTADLSTPVPTKPPGFGILATALRRDLPSEEGIEDAVESAATLNRTARVAMRGAGVRVMA